MREADRFWFGGTVSETAECFRRDYPEGCRHVLSQADNICRNTFVFREHWEMERTNEAVTFGEKVIWDHIPAGDPEWLYALNRHTFFPILGKAWRLTGEERYAHKFAELLSDWIACVPLAQESRENTWRSLEAGIRVENWLKGLLLLEGSAALTKELYDRAEETLLRHGEYLMEVNLPFHDLSNWGVLQNHGLLLLGLWFGRKEWTQEAVRRLDREVYMQVFADGSQWEQSPMYHCEVLYALMDSLHCARRFGISLPRRLEETVHKMARTLADWCKPNGHLPCHGDSDDIDARDLLAQAAILFGDGELKRIAGGIFFEDNLWSFGAAGKADYENLPCREPGHCPAALTDAGNYFLRSSWEEGADYLRFYCGCMGSGHGHGDQLHVDYFSGGEDVLIDPGRYTYVDSPMRKALKLPSGHNTICVDGEEFCSCVDSWGYDKMALPVKGEYKFTGKVNFAMAGHLGYLEKGLFVTRKVLMLEEGLAVLADVIYGTGKHRYESRFHFGSQGTAVLTACGGSACGQGEAGQDGGIARGREEAGQDGGIACGQAMAGQSCTAAGAGPARVHFQGQAVQAEVIFLKGRAALEKAPCSTEYNLLRECDCAKICYEAEGQASMFTVLSAAGAEGQEVSAELLPVSKVRSKEQLSADCAEAVRIVKNGKEHVVIFCHRELISEVDYFTAGGYASYGKTLVFSEDDREGICVQY